MMKSKVFEQVFSVRRAAYRAAVSTAQVFTIAIVVLLFASGLPATSAAQNRQAAFSPAGPSHEFKRAPHVYEWIFQARRGSSPFDRIALRRVTLGPNPPVQPNLVMLYLPGTNMNGEVAIDDPRYSLPLFTASHGVDLWALDYRSGGAPHRGDDRPQAHLRRGLQPRWELCVSLRRAPPESRRGSDAIRRMDSRSQGLVAAAGALCSICAARALCRRYRRTPSHLRKARGAAENRNQGSERAGADSEIQDGGRKPRARGLRFGGFRWPWRTRQSNGRILHPGRARPHADSSRSLLARDSRRRELVHSCNPRIARAVKNSRDRIFEHEHFQGMARPRYQIGIVDRQFRRDRDATRRMGPFGRNLRNARRRASVRACARMAQAASEVGGCTG